MPLEFLEKSEVDFDDSFEFVDGKLKTKGGVVMYSLDEAACGFSDEDDNPLFVKGFIIDFSTVQVVNGFQLQVPVPFAYSSFGKIQVIEGYYHIENTNGTTTRRMILDPIIDNDTLFIPIATGGVSYFDGRVYFRFSKTN